MNDPLCLEDCLRILAEFFRYLMNTKFRSKWKGMLFPNADESEGVSATNFGFMNESLDVPWPCIYWKKGNAIKGVCVRVLEHQSFMFREG